LGVVSLRQILPQADVNGLWQRLAEFPALAGAPLVVKAGVLPGKACEFCRRVLELDSGCSVQAHAGNGVVVARLSRFEPADAARVLVRGLQPAAIACGGHAVVLSCVHAAELTRQAIWGGATDDMRVMQAVREQFDPRGILNPGRFF
jgi:FAD/FMN-containing dehydrogenase